MQFIRRHLTLLILLLVLVAVVGLVVVYPILARERGSRVDTCSSHLRQLGLAMQTYAEDYEGPLPNALTWAADLRPYLVNDWPLHCPEDRRKGERSYEMLQKWGYKPLPQKQADRLILLYEIGKAGPEYRHMDGMYVGLCDGRAKWFERARVTPDVILRGVAP